MKRDMDLVRSILLRFEDSEKVRQDRSILSDLADDATIIGHLAMLEDAGFIEHKDWQPYPRGVKIRLGWRITWTGHEFLEAVRDPEIWRRTKAGAEKLGSWSIMLLADMAAGYIRAKAREHGLPI